MHFIYRIKQLMLMGGDYLSWIIGFYLAISLRYFKTPDWEILEKYIIPLFFLFIIWIVINFINGLYDLGNLKNKKNKFYFTEAALIAFIIGLIFFYIIPIKNISPKTILFLTTTTGYGLSYLWRLIYNKFINNSNLTTDLIFVGYTPESKELIKIIENYPERGYHIQAVFDSENKIKSEDYPFFTVENELENINHYKTDLIIIAPHIKTDETATQKLYQTMLTDTKIVDLSSFYELITGRIPPITFSEAWFLDHLKVNLPIYDRIKSVIDFLAGIIIGLIFIILFPFIALTIKLLSPGPIFFSQKRVGKNNKIFTLYKFRSMYVLNADGSAETHGAQFATKDDKRITPIGKFLRKSRLDELPQCLNLLKREVTLIGPRPERPEIVNELTKLMPFYSLRHVVKPGLTSWAVIHQNYTDTMETSLEKLQYDLYYIKNRSFLLDISILLRTVNIILRMKGQ